MNEGLKYVEKNPMDNLDKLLMWSEKLLKEIIT